MRTTVVLDDVKASELPKAWRRRVKARADERLVVTIARHTGKTSVKPNSTFGMWTDRADVPDATAYVRALRRPRPAGR
jgi:hypothetical protein